MKSLPLSLIVILYLASIPASFANNADEEIMHLIEFLQKSDCSFNRNGNWYSSVKAAGHINMKYSYLRKKGLINSAEQFIDRAASRSSMSGKPYLVRCDDSEAILSSTWFSDELKRYRKISDNKDADYK